MAEKKEQHYVPKFYLRNFTNNNMIHLATLSNDKNIRFVPYNKQCYKDYMYGEDLVWENKLSKFESKWSNLVTDIVINKRIHLTDEEKDDLKDFVAFQVMRTNRKVDIIEGNIHNFNQKLIPIIAKSQGLDLNDKELAELIRTENSSFDRREWAKFNLDLIESNKDKVKDLGLILISNKTSTPFITSNHPAFSLNYYQNVHGLGLLSTGLIYGLPLSPEFLVILFDKQIYHKISDLDLLNISEVEDIKELNYYQYIRSDGVVFSNDSQTIKDVIDFKLSLQIECIKKIARSNISRKFPFYSLQYIDNVLLDTQIKHEVLNGESIIECVRYALQYEPKITFLEMHERAIEFKNDETFIWIRNEKNEESINARFNIVKHYGDSEKIKRFRIFISDYSNGKLV